MAKRAPKYYGFRMYFSANLLYSFLVIPFLLVLLAQMVPEWQKKWDNAAILPVSEVRDAVDSLAGEADSLFLTPGITIDSIVETAIELGEEIGEELEDQNKENGEPEDPGDEDSTRNRVIHTGPGVQISASSENDSDEQLFEKNGPMNRFFVWLFFLTLLSWAAGLIYNLHFRTYFRKLRSGREVPEKSEKYTRKRIHRTPFFNALIVSLPSILVLLYNFIFVLIPGTTEGSIEEETFMDFCLLATLATLLEFLFIYYWQKHRLQILYLEHVFSPEELRQRTRNRRGGKIRDRLMIASMMTTFLPLLIVMAYLLQGLTRIRDMNLEELSPESWEILMGPWGTMIGDDKEIFTVEKVQWMPYANAVDSLSMIVGIVAGIMVSLLYLGLFIRWTNMDLSLPLKELLAKMRSTRGGEAEQYALVRTNDEIGELAEGYNEMTQKIHEHMDHIFTLNRDLEMKVEERTQEVVQQKEEIEAQKEEIQAQLDMVTTQRDTISKQKDQIMDSIQYAEKIQMALLPPALHLQEVLKEHFVLFKPRDIVSGDYYWSAFKEGKLLVAAADCTGHGVPGAFLSVLGISALNELVNRSVGLPSAGQLLEDLRDYVIHSLHQTGERGEANDGIEIALCIIDPVKKELDFAGANRPLYLARKKDPAPQEKGGPSVEIQVIKGDRMPIGIYEQEGAAFTTHHISLVEGDRIYMFSDGYADQLGGPRRKTFRVLHFRKLLSDICCLPMDEQKEILLEKHRDWCGEVEQIDDILVLGMRI